MQVYLIASMCIINLALWLIFFVKFKKRFSTESEIAKTREEYNGLIKDLQKNTLENINLIDLKIEELNEIIEVAELRIKALQQEESFKNSKSVLKNSTSTKQFSTENLLTKNRSKENSASTKKTSRKKENVAATVISQDDAFEINIKKRQRKKQGDLFENDLKIANEEYLQRALAGQYDEVSLNLTDENQQRKSYGRTTSTKLKNQKVHYLDSDGNAYGEVPIMSPKIYMSDTPIEQKKSFNVQVRELFALGFDATEIAHKLKKSTTEVQFVIDMI